jgi:hypothetical protein
MSGTEPPPSADRVLAYGPDELAEAGRGLEKRVGGVDGAAPEVQRVVQVLVDDAEDLRGPDAVRQERGHDRAGAAAHVDVEARVAVQTIFQGRDGTDLVHPADDAAAGEGEGVTLLAPRAPEVLCALGRHQKIPQGPTRRCVVVDDRNHSPVPLLTDRWSLLGLAP